MDILVAWLSMLALFGLITGLVYPPLVLPFTKDKTRKKALSIYGYAFFISMVLGVIFIGVANLETKFFVLFFLSLIALALGLAYPPLMLPWMKEPSKKSVALFYLPAVVLLTVGMYYAKATAPVDPRYDLSLTEMSEAPQERLIEYAGASSLKGDNNVGQPRVRLIEVVEPEIGSGGGYKVLVEYNSDDVVFNSLFKFQLRTDMTKVYRALYTGGYDIDEVTVTAYLTKTGRESGSLPVLISTTSLGRQSAQGIDWDEKTEVLESEALPAAWKVEYVNPEYE